MKRLLHIAFFLALFIPTGAIAMRIQPGIPQKGKPEVKSEQGPKDRGPNLDGIVEVSFKIDNSGKVQVLNINSTSPQLSDYVMKKLGKIQLEEGNTQAGKVIKYRFVFKKQA